MGFFERLKEGLSKTRRNFTDRIQELVGLSTAIDDDFLEELEMILLSADVGVKTTEKLIEAVRQAARKKEIKGTEDVIPFLKKYMAELLADSGQRTRIGAKPTVILVVGVNGVGKTTTIGKLGCHFREQGKSVILAAADTFRAAATEQLTIWAERAGVPIVAHGEGADPAAVVFDAVASAKARKADLLIVDTAGRLHNKAHLMEELKKIRRVIDRDFPEAEVHVLLVLDGTTGQNGVTQARVFRDAVKLSGIVLTKLDGTAKGGVVVSIKEELQLPVYFVGVGEAKEDLQVFDAKEYAEAIF